MKRTSVFVLILWVNFVCVAWGRQPALSATNTPYSVLYTFKGGTDGGNPQSGLVQGYSGNLYGTTKNGGAYGFGTVFEVISTGKETVLYSFTGGSDGKNPYGSLLLDSASNLYGTTVAGGAYGFGTVFKVDTTGKETVLYSFLGGANGQSPWAGLAFDSAGNLYGTTLGGGSSGYGTVFKLDSSGHQTVLHSFTDAGGDGAYPYAGLVLDTANNLYGTTSHGGNSGYGVAFKVNTAGSETVLYSFTGGADGGYPWSGALVLDASGNLYGTTDGGGAKGAGTVFKLDTAGTESVLYSFCSVYGCTDGAGPEGGLVQDWAGNLYGATTQGGASNAGTLFELDTTGKETVLYSFTGKNDGSWPQAALCLGDLGNLFGTATEGGSAGYGVVFKVALFKDSNNWTEFHRINMQRRNPYEKVLGVNNVGSLSLKWRHHTGSWVYSSPAVANGVVYIGSTDHNVYALNAKTGALLWSYETGEWVDSSPAVANGVVYVGSEDSNVYALNAKTGVLLWSYQTGGLVDSSPAVANGVVYVGSYGDYGYLYALNASTGALLWSYNTIGVGVTSSPAVMNGVVYFCDEEGYAYALNATTGALLWSYDTGGLADSSPAVANGAIYFGDEFGIVYALNASTGALLWSYNTGYSVYSSPAVANGVVYVGSEDRNVYALNASTGALLWSYNTGGYVDSDPAVANGVVYVGSENIGRGGHFYALNASTGALLWSYTASRAYGDPAVANGVVYVGGGYQLYAFSLKKGRE